MQPPTCNISLGNYYEKKTVPAVLNSQFHVCTSLTPRPMTVVFGLGTRQRAHAYNIRKWCPTQGTATGKSCEQLFLTMVSLKLWTRLVVGKLHALMSINFVLKSGWVLEPFWSYHCLKSMKSGLNNEYKKWYFCYHTLLHLAVFHVPFEHYESCRS